MKGVYFLFLFFVVVAVAVAEHDFSNGFPVGAGKQQMITKSRQFIFEAIERGESHIQVSPGWSDIVSKLINTNEDLGLRTTECGNPYMDGGKTSVCWRPKD